MTGNLIERPNFAHGSPLLIRDLLEAPVVPRPDHRETIAEKTLVTYVRGYSAKGLVSKQALILKVRFVEAIDRTGVGKVNKVALRGKYL
jgi:fatty-acyl-CoA synthase